MNPHGSLADIGIFAEAVRRAFCEAFVLLERSWLPMGNTAGERGMMNRGRGETQEGGERGRMQDLESESLRGHYCHLITLTLMIDDVDSSCQ